MPLGREERQKSLQKIQWPQCLSMPKQKQELEAISSGIMSEIIFVLFLWRKWTLFMSVILRNFVVIQFFFCFLEFVSLVLFFACCQPKLPERQSKCAWIITWKHSILCDELSSSLPCGWDPKSTSPQYARNKNFQDIRNDSKPHSAMWTNMPLQSSVKFREKNFREGRTYNTTKLK